MSSEFSIPSGSNLEQDRLKRAIAEVDLSDDLLAMGKVLASEGAASRINVVADDFKKVGSVQYHRVFEKAEYRVMAELKMSGHTADEIANLIGWNVHTVKDVLRQPNILDYMRKRIEERGGQDVMNYLAANAMKAAETLVEAVGAEIMPERRDRMNAAEKVLNRIFGMPNQPISQGKTINYDKLTDAELESIARAGVDSSTKTATS